MTIRIISTEHESAGTIRCAHCWDLRATHIEVSHTHDHTPDEHLVVCAECARLAGLLTCSDCVDEKIWVHCGAASGELTPVYAPSELIDNCCAMHARLRLQPAMTKGVSSPEVRAS